MSFKHKSSKASWLCDCAFILVLKYNIYCKIKKVLCWSVTHIWIIWIWPNSNLPCSNSWMTQIILSYKNPRKLICYVSKSSPPDTIQFETTSQGAMGEATVLVIISFNHAVTDLRERRPSLWGWEAHRWPSCPHCDETLKRAQRNTEKSAK